MLDDPAEEWFRTRLQLDERIVSAEAYRRSVMNPGPAGPPDDPKYRHMRALRSRAQALDAARHAPGWLDVRLGEAVVTASEAQESLEFRIGRRLALRRAIAEAGLTAREDEVVARRFFGDESRNAIARDLGISVPRVRGIEKNALWKIGHPRLRKFLLREWP